MLFRAKIRSAHAGPSIREVGLGASGEVSDRGFVDSMVLAANCVSPSLGGVWLAGVVPGAVGCMGK